MSDLQPASPSELPAAESLATAVRHGALTEVTLPGRFAADAVRRYLRAWAPSAILLEGPARIEGSPRRLLASEWAVVSRRPLRMFGRTGNEVVLHAGGLAYVFARGVLRVTHGYARELLGALEQVKPEELDASGRPLSWIPARRPTLELGSALTRAGDVEVVEGGAALPAWAPLGEEAAGTVTTAVIREHFEQLRAHVGFAPFELAVRRSPVHKRGFTTGRVWFDAAFTPLRVALTTCPNSDLAEILATLVHELAHPASRTRDHGRPFKETLVRIAGEVYGAGFFVEARGTLDEEFSVVDAWVTSGIRAALQGREPPRARTGDDGHTARVISKIRKLRTLAADRPGEPEAVAACAQANELTVQYGLDGAHVAIDAAIDDQMIDRFVMIEPGKVWKRDLAHAVAEFFCVFSLAMAKKGRMHFFGKHADVVAAEYLFQISEERIEREATAHIEAWKREAHRRTTRSERVNFCDSAVLAFQRKLKALRDEEQAYERAHPGTSEEHAARLRKDDLKKAEELARVEHVKRGLGWTGASGKSVRHNEAGARAGAALSVVRGLEGGRGPKLLGS